MQSMTHLSSRSVNVKVKVSIKQKCEREQRMQDDPPGKIWAELKI